ncbi:MAG: bifunctional folylpolyglutamate synthase/dihydrofolate synthase [Deltaproteobacteria bacterium]|nr:bifunctional folylpolyglutamate synthase/dihydrofolate synthase [Deltaproteobacteria bacterium]
MDALLPMLSYPDALERLLEITSSPRMGLGRMELLLSFLGDPHRSFSSIHVAGTNGKGSTLAFCDALLAKVGLRRGRTTSPHLTCARERICLNGESISAELFCQLEAKVASAASRMGDDRPTFFERMIALSFLAFEVWEVDVALVEVGLGGRLDATNVLHPEVCGISRIAIDHTRWLGDDVKSIAKEKAGIFCEGVPVFYAEQEELVADVLEDCAKKTNAFLLRAEILPDEVKIGLQGAHQRENASLALALVSSFLEKKGVGYSGDALFAALSEASWSGRLEFFDDLNVMLDGAHNENAARALARAFDAPPTWTLLFGATEGHDAKAFARALVEEGLRPSRVWITQASAPRSVASSKMIQDVQSCFSCEVVEKPLQDASEVLLSSSTYVLVTGSLYLVGEVRSWLREMPVDPVLPFF